MYRITSLRIKHHTTQALWRIYQDFFYDDDDDHDDNMMILYIIYQLPATLVEKLGHLQLELPSHVQTRKTCQK